MSTSARHNGRIALAVAVAAAGLAFGATVWRRAVAGTASSSTTQLAALVDQELGQTATKVRARAASLAMLPRLAAAVATDEATARDLTDEELAVAPQPDETIALAQLAADGDITVLLTLPAGRHLSIDWTRPGRRAVVTDGALLLCQVVAITPSERSSQLSGRLAVCARAALPRAVEALEAAGATASLDVGAQTLLLGRSGALLAKEPSLPLLDGVVTLRLSAPARAPVGQLFGAAVALSALAFAAALAWPRRARAAAAETLADPDPAAAPVTPAAAVTPEDTPAQCFGRYTILRRLGAGGTAEVYLARATGEAGFVRRVALKVLIPHLAGDALLVEHFLDEARLAAQLTHPNLVHVSDLGRHGDRYFIAMEYVDGADLLQLVRAAERRRQPIPPGIALRIVAQVCAGLHAAHTAVHEDGTPLGIVHRDVKSANVLVARSGAVKVGDFGVAKAHPSHRAGKTVTGQIKGTLSYMAPEHRLAAPVDARADQYGVAAIAYELLATRTIDLDYVRLALLGRDGWPHLEPLSALRPELPAELDGIVRRALAYEPSARFADCAALQDAIEAVATRRGWVENDRTVGRWVSETLAAAELVRDA